jgi:hypothetical protein
MPEKLKNALGVGSLINRFLAGHSFRSSQRREIRHKIACIAFRDAEVRHRSSRFHFLGMLQPFLHVDRLIQLIVMGRAGWLGCWSCRVAGLPGCPVAKLPGCRIAGFLCD